MRCGSGWKVAHMAERHTADFDRVSLNILSDAERGTITLQFDSPIRRREFDHVKRLLKAITRRYGGSFRSRLRRRLAGEGRPLLVAGRSGPHPENADIFCLELALNHYARME